MDQNAPRDDATGPQSPADPNQAAGADQAQAPGGNQEAAAEYAAWSADATYQQQQAADTQAYAAPEPQSATYSEQPAPPADTQAYAQQQQPAPPADTQAYAQQQPQPPAYDQQAYAQQQQAYAQQQQAYAQQQQQQPPAYDQQAYAQQQQAYAQQQQAYAQQQQQQPPAYDQQAYAQQQPPAYDQQQPQYYDQSAYGQQPGYYDQSAYGQQQAPQQGYQQPYGYGQPGQPQAWPGDAQHWEEGATGYGRSFIAILAGFAMLTWGIAIAMGGALLLWTNDLLGHLQDVTLSADVVEIVERMDDQVVATGGILVILGIIFMIGAVGVLAHRRWGRAFGIVLGLLGTILGIAIIFAAVGFEILDGAEVGSVIEGEEASLGSGIFVTATFLLILLGMFIGRRHFKKMGVEG